MNSYKELIVWQKAIELVAVTYDICKYLPSEEQFGLASQMQRAAVSIPSNIAEGYRSNNRREYSQFCAVALGSAAELETQLIITAKIYSSVKTKQAMDLDIEVQKMLAVLISKLKTSPLALRSRP